MIDRAALIIAVSNPRNWSDGTKPLYSICDAGQGVAVEARNISGMIHARATFGNFVALGKPLKSRSDAARSAINAVLLSAGY